MHFIKISENWTGLSNQLFALIAGIIEAKRAKITQVQIGPFNASILKPEYISIDKVIDLQATSQKVGLLLEAAPHNHVKPKPVNFKWYTSFNKEEFLKTLRAITFKKVFYEMSEYIIKNFVKTNSLNVVHFRIEEDGMKHWSNVNKIPPEKWKTIIYTKYMQLVKKYIPENSHILALTYHTNSTLLKKLSKNFKIYCFDIEPTLKQHFGSSGRELCAIVDLLMGLHCTKTFIGCHNFVKKRGSTFSYILWNLMPEAERGIFIDLDDIQTPEQQLLRSSKEKVYIYFHICTIAHWEKVVLNLWKHIVESGLLNVVSGVHIVVLGNELEKVKQLLKHPLVKIIYHSLDTQIYERKCLELLREHATRENFKALYIHSKGVSKGSAYQQNISDWVELLIYYNIDNYNVCLKTLDSYDTCGVNLRNPEKCFFPHSYSICTHYSGNFWWANSKYLKNLPEKVGPKYLDPEFWIAQSSTKKMAGLWDSNINHYYGDYPKERYQNKQNLYCVE